MVEAVGYLLCDSEDLVLTASVFPKARLASMLCFSAQFCNFVLIIFSSHLLKQLISEMGLYDEICSAGLSFFKIMMILEDFQDFGM